MSDEKTNLVRVLTALTETLSHCLSAQKIEQKCLMDMATRLKILESKQDKLEEMQRRLDKQEEREAWETRRKVLRRKEKARRKDLPYRKPTKAEGGLQKSK